MASASRAEELSIPIPFLFLERDVLEASALLAKDAPIPPFFTGQFSLIRSFTSIITPPGQILDIVTSLRMWKTTQSFHGRGGAGRSFVTNPCANARESSGDSVLPETLPAIARERTRENCSSRGLNTMVCICLMYSRRRLGDIIVSGL